MEHSTHRTSSITEDPTLNTPSSRSPPIALIFLPLLGSLYALTSNTPQALAGLFLTTAIWYLTPNTPGRNYKDMIMYTILSYVSAFLATSIFGNIWLRSVGAHVMTFLSMDLYVRYLQAKEEAARMKQKRDLQVAKYLDEPAPKGQDIAAEKVQEFMDGKDANVPTARKGPSTRRRG